MTIMTPAEVDGLRAVLPAALESDEVHRLLATVDALAAALRAMDRAAYAAQDMPQFAAVAAWLEVE